MLSLALVILAQTSAPEDWIRPPRLERVQRAGGRSGPSYAFFEFAPASGAGMGAVCACTTPTGAKGEALTFTRGSSATCTKTATGGLATTGIANGDLVTCSTDKPRVEYDSAGTLGLLVESARTNVLLRSDALTNAAWADVGTPNATDGATDPFGGTTGDTLTDNAAGAFEGRSQAVTVSAATAYIMSCYLKGTTSAKARLSLDGTTCDTSTLSSTTWSLVTCADASSSGVSISAQVLVGNAVGDTGDIVVGGCQVEAGAYATSYMPTTAAPAARLIDAAYFVVGSTNVGSIAVSRVGSPLSGSTVRAYLSAQTAPASGAPSLLLYADTTSARAFATSVFTGVVSGATTSGRSWAWISGSTLAGYVDGISTGTVGGASIAAATHIRIGDYGGTQPANSILSRICVDPSPDRCR